MADGNKGVSILQDVKKMKRSIKLRSATDPGVVNVILDNILRDSLLARQALGSTRLGKNAINEIKAIRNDLISGAIDAGENTKEQIAKFTAVYNEASKIEDEQKQTKASSSGISDLKASVRDILPSKSLVTSALIAANPIAGYAFKVGSNLLSRDRNTIDDNFNADEILNYDKPKPKGSTSSTGDNEVIERLDSIVDYLEKMYPSVERLEDNSSLMLRTERDKSQSDMLLAREEAFESFDGSSSVERVGGRDALTDTLVAGLASTLGGSSSDDGESNGSRRNIADIAAGTAAGTILTRLIGGTALLASAKIFAVATAGYFLYKYKDEILGWLRDFETPGALGIPGGSEGIRESVSSTAAAIQEMDDYINNQPLMKGLLDSQKSMENNLESSQQRFDELMERSNEEMLNGGITEETANEMRELNAEMELLKDSLENLKDQIRDTRVSERRNYTSSRQNEDVVQMSRGDDFNTFADLIRAAESAHGQFNPDGSTVVGPVTRFGRAVGAMQILESTAEEQANRMGIEYDKDRLYNDEDYNRMIGEGYLSFLLDRYNGNATLASFGYNAGPGAADRMRREFGTPGEDISTEDFLRSIENTYPSTRFSSWADQTVPYVRKTGALMSGSIDTQAMQEAPNVSSTVSNSLNSSTLTEQPQQQSHPTVVNVSNNNNVSQQGNSSPMPSSENNEPTWRRIVNNNLSFRSL